MTAPESLVYADARREVKRLAALAASVRGLKTLPNDRGPWRRDEYRAPKYPAPSRRNV